MRNAVIAVADPGFVGADHPHIFRRYGRDALEARSALSIFGLATICLAPGAAVPVDYALVTYCPHVTPRSSCDGAEAAIGHHATGKLGRAGCNLPALPVPVDDTPQICRAC